MKYILLIWLMLMTLILGGLIAKAGYTTLQQVNNKLEQILNTH